MLQELRARGHAPRSLFLEASEETLVRRYHESRRRHPVAGDGSVLEGIQAERKALAHLREIADRIIDTSHSPCTSSSSGWSTCTGTDAPRAGLAVPLVSFGYKYGIPYDADLVFDCASCRTRSSSRGSARRTGGARGGRFVLEPEAGSCWAGCATCSGYLLPRYQREGKAYLTVAVGCTGGRHRSVALVEELREDLERQSLTPLIRHRDLGRE